MIGYIPNNFQKLFQVIRNVSFTYNSDAIVCQWPNRGDANGQLPIPSRSEFNAYLIKNPLFIFLRC
jgi:hypothetical protein